MNKERIEELVRECYDFNANCSISRVRAVLTTAVREAYEEAAKVLDKRIEECDGMIATAPLTPRGVQLYEDYARECQAQAAAIRKLGEGL